MNDICTEQLIKRKKSKGQWFLEGMVLAATLLSVYGVVHCLFFIVLTVILLVMDIYLYLEFDAEYEYLFVNGELDVDKIIHKSRRRRICTIKLEEIEVLAPFGTGELRQYQRAKKSDYSSGRRNDQITFNDIKEFDLDSLQENEIEELRKIIFEPNQTIVDGYAGMIPGKVTYKSAK